MVQEDLRRVIAEVLEGFDFSEFKSASEARGTSSGPAGAGTFSDLTAAVEAAKEAQLQLMELGLDARRNIIAAMRRIIIDHARELSDMAVEETGMGNADDKVIKHMLAAKSTPGVEDLEPVVYTDEHGLTLTERAPYGVIGAVIPSTNPTATVTSNGIGMVSAGNSVVFNPHPSAKKSSCRAIELLNESIVAAGGPRNLLTAVGNPTIESAAELMNHPDIAILVVTGGPGVVRAALKSTKKVIAAGPGNPPVVVDETADLENAGRHIVNGAGFDRNIICVCEKEVIVVESAADRLKAAMRANGAHELTAEEVAKVTSLVIAEPGGPGRDGAPNKAYVGKSPRIIAAAIGLEVADSTRVLLCDVPNDHPLVWTEQLMPVLPITRVPDVDAGIDLAFRCEHGYRHSAMMHSRNIDKLSKMARLMNCSLFVKNGPSYAGLGEGGAGYTSFTIASPTGEGITRARTFTRERRCTLVDSFRIV